MRRWYPLLYTSVPPPTSLGAKTECKVLLDPAHAFNSMLCWSLVSKTTMLEYLWKDLYLKFAKKKILLSIIIRYSGSSYPTLRSRFWRQNWMSVLIGLGFINQAWFWQSSLIGSITKGCQSLCWSIFEPTGNNELSSDTGQFFPNFATLFYSSLQLKLWYYSLLLYMISQSIFVTLIPCVCLYPGTVSELRK